MTAEELEALLDGSEESPTLEFKGPMAWEKHGLVKDILAMANVTDGGVIVFGIEDRSLKRVGLSDEQLATFDQEAMRDQIAPYADPYVVFRCEVLQDSANLKYVVLQVSPFEEVPVVCRRDGPDLTEGTIYYRSQQRRAQSAPVRSSTDMRSIIETSIARRLRSLRRAGLAEQPALSYDYDAELGGL